MFIHFLRKQNSVENYCLSENNNLLIACYITVRIPQPQKLSPHSVQGSKFSILDENNLNWGTSSPPHLIKFHFPQLMRMCCIKSCAGKTIRVPDDAAQLKGSMCLYKRDFKTHSSQIVCLLRGLFSINDSLKSTAPAVVQSPCFLSTP